jgi:hypothetical protein
VNDEDEFDEEEENDNEEIVANDEEEDIVNPLAMSDDMEVALREGNVGEIRRLLDDGENVNAVANDGLTQEQQLQLVNEEIQEAVIDDVEEEQVDLGAFGRSNLEGMEILSSFVIPDGFTSISAYTFSGNTSITSIVIPNSVTSIEHWAFYNCSSLVSINIPEGVTSIGHGAFNGCFVVGLNYPPQ